MFKIGNSLLFDDIELPENATSLKLIWVDVSKQKLKAPNKYLLHWQERGTQKGYWLGQYLVTQAHWQSIAVPIKKDADPKQINYPATNIDWIQAMQYCRLLNLRYKEKLPEGYHFSLPTGAYWGHAGESGCKQEYSESLKEDSHSMIHTEVGKVQTNELGFCDMLNNVEEWCYDVFIDTTSNSLNYIANINNDDAPEIRSLRGSGDIRWQEYRLANYGNLWEGAFTPNGIGFRVCLRPIFDWPNCDLNDPLLIEEGINMLD